MSFLGPLSVQEFLLTWNEYLVQRFMHANLAMQLDCSKAIDPKGPKRLKAIDPNLD